MPLETLGFTKRDLAKYPLLKKTADHVKKLELKPEEMANPQMEQSLNRAEEMVKTRFCLSPLTKNARTALKFRLFLLQACWR